MNPFLLLVVGLAGAPQDDVPRAPGGSVLPAEPALAAKYRRRDAQEDDWSSEVLSQRAAEQLGRLADWLAGSEGVDALASLFAESAQVPELSPASAAEVFRDTHLTVSRWDSTSAVGAETEAAGAPAGERLARWRASFGDEGPTLRAQFKVLDLQVTETGARSHVYVQAAREGVQQQTAEWSVDWAGLDEEPLAIARVQLEQFEEVRVDDGAGPLLRDCTRSILPALERPEELAHGREHWAARIDGALGISLIGHEGLAVGDLSGDGLDDVFVCQPGGLANRVLVQRPDGTVEDRAAQLGLDHLDHTRSVLILDIDGDGDRDLVAAIEPWLVFFENGGATFQPRAALDVGSVTALSAADFDRDGDLDVYACGYMLPDARERSPVPYHDANNGRANSLARNVGGWRFVNATAEVGLDQNNRRFSFAAAWEDYDNDGDQDLYVANDFGRNNLYRNDGGHFVDVAAEAGVEDIAAGMGVSWADVDRDGWMDLYVSNMFSSAGERVTYQRQFRPEVDASVRDLYKRHARGNTLFRNDGRGGFEDVSLERGVTHGRWAWGAVFVDLNNDGWQDLYVPNGFITGESPGDL